MKVLGKGLMCSAPLTMDNSTHVCSIILLGDVSFTCGHTAGFVPLVLTVNVSPPGGHSVRIVASSGGEDTVSYTISDTKTEGENRAIVSLS